MKRNWSKRKCLMCGQWYVPLSGKQQYCGDRKIREGCSYKRRILTISLWKKKHSQKVRQWIKDWEGRNYEKVRISVNKSRRKWAKNHPEYFSSPRYKVDSNFGKAIRDALRGEKNGLSWEKLVGYTLQGLMFHLEKLFIPEMSWDNYGSYWHIDHIKPKSLFNYESYADKEFRECWALKNLQPLEAIANFRKGARY